MQMERLATMLNQIARNLAAHGDAKAVALVAQHVSDFWAPQMKEAITACPADLLDPIAQAVVLQLRSHGV